MKCRFGCDEFAGVFASKHEDTMGSLFVTESYELDFDLASVFGDGLTVLDGEGGRFGACFLKLRKFSTKFVGRVVEFCVFF